MRLRLSLTVAMVLVVASTQVAAHELPIRSYTIADGLADNRVHRIVLDSRGLLWICTSSGISRFDGSQFQSFGVPEGLPHPIINDLLETSDGDFWLASNGGGVIRFRVATAGPRYEAFSVDREPTSNRVNRLFRAADGTVWVGTDGGLFRMTERPQGSPGFTRVGLRRRGHPDEMVQVWSFADDREGTLWVGTRFGLVSILRGGRIVSYPVRQELETDHVYSLLYTHEDDVLWIGHQSGLALFKPPAAASYSSDGPIPEPLEDRSIVRVAAQQLAMQNGPAVTPHAPREAVYFATSQSGRVAFRNRSPSVAVGGDPRRRQWRRLRVFRRPVRQTRGPPAPNRYRLRGRGSRGKLVAGEADGRRSARGTPRVHHLPRIRWTGAVDRFGLRGPGRRAHRPQSGLACQSLRRSALPHRPRECAEAGTRCHVDGEPEGDRGSSRRLVVCDRRRAGPIFGHPARRGPRNGSPDDLHHARRPCSGQHQPSLRRFTRRHLDCQPGSRSRSADSMGSRVRPFSEVLRSGRLACVQFTQRLLRGRAPHAVHHASRRRHRALQREKLSGPVRCGRSPCWRHWRSDCRSGREVVVLEFGGRVSHRRSERRTSAASHRLAVEADAHRVGRSLGGRRAWQPLRGQRQRRRADRQCIDRRRVREPSHRQPLYHQRWVGWKRSERSVCGPLRAGSGSAPPRAFPTTSPRDATAVSRPGFASAACASRGSNCRYRPPERITSPVWSLRRGDRSWKLRSSGSTSPLATHSRSSIGWSAPVTTGACRARRGP